MKPKKILYWALCCLLFVSCSGEEDEDVSSSTQTQPVFDHPLPVSDSGKSTVSDSTLNVPFAGYQTGDIIFQTTSGRLMLPLQQATGNEFTHCGLVVVSRQGQTFVIEAFDSVMRTPVDAWISRGVNGKYAVLRVKNSHLRINESSHVKLRHQAKSYQGLPYDSKYGWTDDKMYCSELVYKLMLAMNITLCATKPLKSYDLSTAAVQRALQQVYGGSIPYNEPMVSPGDLFNSNQLEIVYQN